MTEASAIVLFSGGQDSTTCLAWALHRYQHVETVGFAYGQRHAIELACREPLRTALATLNNWGPRLGPDHLVDMTQSMSAIGATALTTNAEITVTADNLPTTFVPGRNLLFLTYAAAIAYRRGIKHIVGGMCETDYSGYPDCRDDTIKAMQLALNLGMQRRFVLETPLMWRDKAATWSLAHDLGGDPLVALILEHTHSCYRGDRTHRHEYPIAEKRGSRRDRASPRESDTQSKSVVSTSYESRYDWGYGCGACPACDLRASGWKRWRESVTTTATTQERT